MEGRVVQCAMNFGLAMGQSSLVGAHVMTSRRAVLTFAFYICKINLRSINLILYDTILPSDHQASGFTRQAGGAPKFLKSHLTDNCGCPILPRSLRKGGFAQTSLPGGRCRILRHGQARPLPAVRLFSLCNVQLLSSRGAAEQGHGLRCLRSGT